VLNGIRLALAHRNRQAVAFGHLAVGAAGTGVPGVLEHRLREAAKLAGLAGKTMVLRHGGAIITRVQDDFVSKTRRKREMLELQTLGATLAALPEAQLERIALPEELREAVVQARRIRSHEAKRRQMQYVGRLMREVDSEPIRTQLAALEGGSAQAAAAHRRLEAWRARLLEDDAALTEFAGAHPDADLQKIRTLIRNARQEQQQSKPPRAYRELFRMLKSLDP
jgi:ribosome-associated protein